MGVFHHSSSHDENETLMAILVLRVVGALWSYLGLPAFYSTFCCYTALSAFPLPSVSALLGYSVCW